MNQLHERGGARIGRVRASWPFALLKVNREQLTLNATLINYTFRPEDVTAIEPVGFGLGKGIRIHHRVGKFSNKVIFWTSAPLLLISEIRQTGFMDTIQPLNDQDEELIRNRKWMDSVPVKTWVLIALIVLWNGLTFLGKFLFPEKGTRLPFDGGMWFSMGFLMLFCLTVLFVKPVQSFILKEGRLFREARPMVWFIAILAAFFFLNFSFMRMMGIH